MEKKILVGETKGFLFFMGYFFGKKKLFTSLLIERQEKSQNLGSIPRALQKLCKKNQAPGTKYPPPPPPGANRVNTEINFSFSTFLEHWF